MNKGLAIDTTNIKVDVEENCGEERRVGCGEERRVAMFSEFEIENNAARCDLDEMGIHRVFERMDERQAMRENARSFPEGWRRVVQVDQHDPLRHLQLRLRLD